MDLGTGAAYWGTLSLPPNMTSLNIVSQRTFASFLDQGGPGWPSFLLPDPILPLGPLLQHKSLLPVLGATIFGEPKATVDQGGQGEKSFQSRSLGDKRLPDLWKK